MSNSKRGNGSGSLYQRTAGGRWLAAWYDHAGNRIERSTMTSDKRAAERILSKWTTDATLRRTGVIDATAEAIALSMRNPINEYLKAYERFLSNKGSTPSHVKRTLIYANGRLMRISHCQHSQPMR